MLEKIQMILASIIVSIAIFITIFSVCTITTHMTVVDEKTKTVEAVITDASRHGGNHMKSFANYLSISSSKLFLGIFSRSASRNISNILSRQVSTATEHKSISSWVTSKLSSPG